jgi:hypothetical protein
MNAIFIDELSTVRVFSKVHAVLASKYSAVQLADLQGLDEISFRRYLKVHSFYSLDEYLMFKNDSQFYCQP